MRLWPWLSRVTKRKYHADTHRNRSCSRRANGDVAVTVRFERSDSPTGERFFCQFTKAELEELLAYATSVESRWGQHPWSHFDGLTDTPEEG